MWAPAEQMQAVLASPLSVKIIGPALRSLDQKNSSTFVMILLDITVLGFLCVFLSKELYLLVWKTIT